MVAVLALTDCDVLAPGTPGGRRALWSGQAYDLTAAQVEEAGDNVQVTEAEAAPTPEPAAEEKPKRRRRTRKKTEE